MAVDNRQGSKVSQNVRREDNPGTRVEPYPYLGKVKNNVDPTRSGRLQVWVAEFGGAEEDPKNWRTVSYASPYMGTTDITEGGSKNNVWTEVPHTYGLWMVPPDVGIQVLVIFVAGDPSKGYWFACVNSHLSRYMLPGLAASTAVDSEHVSSDVSYDSGPAIVTEFNSNDPKAGSDSKFMQEKKPIHEPQQKILVTQGLEADTVRGVLTSSSQRETPSKVFGISTPGRPQNDPAEDPSFDQKVKSGSLKEEDYAVKTRLGGHTFIMDDGDVKGENKLVRIRSSSGHQIVMNDTANTLYFCNTDGKVWMEFTASGHLMVYAEGGIDIRTKGIMNFHADMDINIQTNKKLKIKAVEGIQMDCKSLSVLADSDVIFKASSVGIKAPVKISGDTTINGALTASGECQLGNGGGGDVKAPDALKPNKLPETTLKDKKWEQEKDKLQSIVTIAPTHEPSPKA